MDTVRTVIVRPMTSPEDSRLKRIRNQRGFTRPELAVASGVSVKTIQRLEDGEISAQKSPRRQTIRALAQALNTSEADLGYDAYGDAPSDLPADDVRARLERIEAIVTRILQFHESVAAGQATHAAEEAAQAAEDLAAAAATRPGARRPAQRQ